MLEVKSTQKEWNYSQSVSNKCYRLMHFNAFSDKWNIEVHFDVDKEPLT